MTKENRIEIDDVAKDWLNHAIVAAIRLKLPEIIKEQPADYKDIASQAEAKPDEIKRILRALSANGYFTRSSGWKYSHNERSRMLTNDSKTGLRSMMLLSGQPSMLLAWSKLAEGIASGRSPFALANGCDLYTYLAQHPDAAKVFNEAMVGFTLEQAAGLLTHLPELQKKSSILDIAGGMGQLLAAILQSCPNSTGAVFDLPALKHASENYLQTRNLKERARFIEGSFLELIPDGFSLYIVKNALLNWSDENVIKILSNIGRVLKDDARLLIIEPLITSDNEAWTSLMDLQMLVAPTGRCRTIDEYQDLTHKSRLKICRTIETGQTSVLECSSAA